MTDTMAMATTPTELIHLSYEGNFQLSCSATITSCRCIKSNDAQNNNGANKDDDVVSVEVQLDRTTMHPQGGGQPSDIGTLLVSGKKDDAIRISKVMLDRNSGTVTHTGTVSQQGILQVGDQVEVVVEAQHRRILSECHTAGHVVDSAMARCHLVMPPTKGYHYLDGPYVEYKGSIPPEKRASVLDQLKAAFVELLEEDIPTAIQTLSRQEAEKACNRLQNNFDFSAYEDGDQIRIVTVANFSCPCGGTHVRSTGELKERGWNVLGIKSKKGVVRVKYGASGLRGPSQLEE